MADRKDIRPVKLSINGHKLEGGELVVGPGLDGAWSGYLPLDFKIPTEGTVRIRIEFDAYMDGTISDSGGTDAFRLFTNWRAARQPRTR